jgi:hypothetical protein
LEVRGAFNPRLQSLIFSHCYPFKDNPTSVLDGRIRPFISQIHLGMVPDFFLVQKTCQKREFSYEMQFF